MGENESLETLTARLDEVLAGLAEVRTRVSQFGARLDTETGPVMVLQTQVKQLRKKLDEIARKLAGAKPPGGDEPSAPRWDGLDAKAEAKQLETLHSWVEGTLRVQYPGYLRTLPPCWPAHREALWELGTLQAEWNRVFGSADPPLAETQWWHERWLPGLLVRLRAAIRCDSAQCSLRARPGRGQGPGTVNDPRAPLSFPGLPGPRG